MTTPNRDDLVRQGYDDMAERYLSERSRWGTVQQLDRLLDRLDSTSRILDVGCGAGVPVAEYLSQRDHTVIGIDVSKAQVAMATKNVPAGEFMIRDMRDLEVGEFQVDAVVSFYAIFHTPRESHAETLHKLASFLPNGGWLLVTMGSEEWEGVEEFHGVEMYWSHFGPGRNRELVEAAGFEVVTDIIDESDGERHQVIMATSW